jgi:hypothetical protein
MINRKLLGYAGLIAVLIQLSVLFFSWQAGGVIDDLTRGAVFRNVNWARVTLEQSRALSEKQDRLGKTIFVGCFFCLFTVPLLAIQWAPFKRRVLTSVCCSATLFVFTMVSGLRLFS